MQKSLIDLCILAIGKITDNLFEILTNIVDISPIFEKKVHCSINKSVLFESIGEQKKWYKSGELRVHKICSTKNTIKCTKFFKSGKIYQLYTKCNDKKIGIFAEFFANGKQRIKKFIENDIETKYTLWQANGYKLRNRSKINDGLYEEEVYHSNGLLASLEFVYWKKLLNEKRNSMQIYWNRDGMLNRIETWENGHRVKEINL